jgi:hypothetical protein
VGETSKIELSLLSGLGFNFDLAYKGFNFDLAATIFNLCPLDHEESKGWMKPQKLSLAFCQAWASTLTWHTKDSTLI